MLIEYDESLDRAIEEHLPEAYRGSRKGRLRVDYVVRDWLKSRQSPTVSGNGVSESVGRGLPAPAAASDAPARRSA